MLAYELLEDEGILIVSPQKALEKSDFQKLQSIVDPYIESKGSLTGLMIYTESFPGWESFAALISHLEFVKDHHKKIEKVAAVTSSGLLSIMPKFANHFIKAKIKHFEFDNKSEALAWLRAPV
jgi:hypothetical protein